MKKMSIIKNKKISRNPDARYLVAEALTKLIHKIFFTTPYFIQDNKLCAKAEYLLAELEDAGISGIVWSQKEGVFKSDKSR